MKILVNDHSGHAFTIQLARQIAIIGHEVIYTCSANFQSPKGPLEKQITDSPNLQIELIYYDKQFHKYSIIKRRKQELEFAVKLISIIKLNKPEVILCANTPLFAQEKILNYCNKINLPFYFWCQDIYSIAIEKILKKKIGFPITLLANYFRKKEIFQLKNSKNIIVITDDFLDIFKKWGIDISNVSVIPNWSQLPVLNELPKKNQWSIDNNISDKFCITYSGTLGLKHNPEFILDTAKYFRTHSDVLILIISEGLGANYLNKKKIEYGLENLKILPFQQYKDLEFVSATTDIFIALLESDAGVFSVPSKVLTYLCSSKPTVLAAPTENLSSKIINQTESGFAVNPNNSKEFIEKLDFLYNNEILRKNMGINGRAYSEQEFDIELIAKKFLNILHL